MLAYVNSQLTWSLAGVAVLAGAWVAVRAWIRRGSDATRAMKHRLTDGSLSPRGQHYHFAHTALRALTFEDPEAVVAALADADADLFLGKLWQAVGKDVVASGEPGDEGAMVASDGLEAIPARVAGRPAAVVRMPEPRATTEAHFVAVVLNHELDEPAKPAPEPHAYYFTLENGFSLDATPRTAFCEWDGATHKNYGDGPPADARRFLERVAQHLGAVAATRVQARPQKHSK